MSERQPVDGRLLLAILEQATAAHEAALEPLGIEPAHLIAFHLRRCRALLATIPEPGRSMLAATIMAQFAMAQQE